MSKPQGHSKRIAKEAREMLSSAGVPAKVKSRDSEWGGHVSIIIDKPADKGHPAIKFFLMDNRHLVDFFIFDSIK